MRHRGKKIAGTVLAGVLACSLVLPVVAETSVKDATKKKDSLESQLKKVEKQMAALKEKSEDTQEYLDSLDGQLADLSKQLVSVENSLTQTEKELQETQEALKEAETIKDNQYEDMKKRIKFMYENGDAAYLEMILEAEDFTDMLNKADYVKAISEYDRTMMVEFQNTVDGIAEKEAQIEKQYKEIEALKESVEAQKKTVESVTKEKEKEMDNLSDEIAASKEKKEEYEAELAAQEALIAKLEAEALRKAEEERKKAQAAQNAAGSNDNSSSNTGTTSSTGWTWPLPGHSRITSEYGTRMHPTLGYMKFHNGIDVGAPTGTPIVAPKDGTVIAAAYNATMGNYIMIDHGNGIITIYMHCSSLAVSSGKKVSIGQTIAYVGSTGRSTGPHLHFGVRVNGEYVSPWKYVSK